MNKKLYRTDYNKMIGGVCNGIAECKTALMKERSPSCGSGTIYDGTFTGTVIPGDGVAAEKLRAAGVQLFGESEIEKLI